MKMIPIQGSVMSMIKSYTEVITNNNLKKSVCVCVFVCVFVCVYAGNFRALILREL